MPHSNPTTATSLSRGRTTDPTALDPLVPSLIFVKSNGSLDTNFGIGGIVESTTNLLQDSPHVALAVQSGGGIVVGGTAVTGTNGQPTSTAFVERFNSNGTPDSSFGVLGLAVPLFGGSSSSLGGLALDGGGNIVVAGTEAGSATASVPLVAVARLNEHGTLDSSFGSGGIATADLFGTNPSIAVDGMAIDPSRGIVVEGTVLHPTGAVSPNYHNFFVTRFGSDGVLDPSFNGGQADLVGFPQSEQGGAEPRSRGLRRA